MTVLRPKAIGKLGQRHRVLDIGPLHKTRDELIRGRLLKRETDHTKALMPGSHARELGHTSKVSRLKCCDAACCSNRLDEFGHG